LQVLRIIQEAINNALKHAKASEILVSARHVEGRGFDIRIEDDGIGIDANVVEGRGLENLRRRAREVGANLTIERRGPGGGTRVALNFL
jgi:signal transduction histidine kinase